MHFSTPLRSSRERGITIFSKQAEFSLPHTEVTLLDTPGHVDFSAEMERTLQVLDYAVLVISGTDGVQAHTETLWRLLARHGIPTFLFVNKMDLDGAERVLLLRELKTRLSSGVVDFGDEGMLHEEPGSLRRDAARKVFRTGNSRRRRWLCVSFVSARSFRAFSARRSGWTAWTRCSTHSTAAPCSLSRRRTSVLVCSRSRAMRRETV